MKYKWQISQQQVSQFWQSDVVIKIFWKVACTLFTIINKQASNGSFLIISQTYNSTASKPIYQFWLIISEKVSRFQPLSIFARKPHPIFFVKVLSTPLETVIVYNVANLGSSNLQQLDFFKDIETTSEACLMFSSLIEDHNRIWGMSINWMRGIKGSRVIFNPVMFEYYLPREIKSIFQ